MPAAAAGAEPADYFGVRDVMRKVAEALSTTVNDAAGRIETMLGDRETLLKQIEETKGVASVSAEVAAVMAVVAIVGGGGGSILVYFEGLVRNCPIIQISIWHQSIRAHITSLASSN